MMVVSMLVAVMAMVVMTMAVGATMQHPGARQVDDEPHRGDGDRFVEADRHRRAEAAEGLPGDEQRHQGEDDRTGKSREVAELAGADGEARVEDRKSVV